MSKQLDDLDAVRTLVETLESFDSEDQKRIIRWAQEKLGICTISTPMQTGPSITGTQIPQQEITHEIKSGQPKNIKTFIDAKNPKSENQFAATVAYYYRFEAPEIERKDSITSEDLLEACRKANRTRIKNPGQTLRNAHGVGLLDKFDRGSFTINSVGENLVAMTLPGQSSDVGTKKKINVKTNKKKKVKNIRGKK